MNLPIQRQPSASVRGDDGVGAARAAGQPAADAGIGDSVSADRFFSAGFFVAVGDGTHGHALAQQADACRQAMASALDGALLEPQRMGPHPIGIRDISPAPAPAVPGEVAQEVTRQEQSIHGFLKLAFGRATDRISHQVHRSLPGLAEKGLEFGLRKMTSVALQLGPGLAPHVADEVARIALPWIASGVVHVGMAMQSHIEGLLEHIAPPPTPAA